MMAGSTMLPHQPPPPPPHHHQHHMTPEPDFMTPPPSAHGISSLHQIHPQQVRVGGENKSIEE